jgi:hypothetical protein
MREKTLCDAMSLISAWTKTNDAQEIEVIKACIIETLQEDKKHE